MFNPNFRPIETTPEQGSNWRDQNWGGAFNIPGVNSAQMMGPGQFRLFKGTGDERQRAKASVDGTNVKVADWISDPVQSDADFLKDAAMLAAAAYGGLSAGGFLGGAGAGAGAGVGAAAEGAGGLGITEAGLAGAGEAAAGTAGYGGTAGGVTGLSTGSGLSGMTAPGAVGGGSLFGSAGELLSKIPTRVWGAIGSGLLSSAGGGGSGGGNYSGPMPTITRGGWQSQVTPKYMSLFDVGSLVKGKP